MFYVNVYRTGGYLNAKWHVCAALPEPKAIEQAERIRRAGYKCLTKTLKEHRAIGLPVVYCAKCDPITGECRKNGDCLDFWARQ